LDFLRPEAFFDLSNSGAADLFKGVKYVWEAVLALPGYIEKVIKPDILGEVEEGAWVEPGRVRLEEGSVVERGAIVRGPTIIGRNSVIRTGAYVRGHVMVGDDCMIGHGTETRQLLVLNHTNIPHHNCFFTSLVGNSVRIGGVTNTANFRLDGQEVVIKVNVDDHKRSFPTGQTLFGAVIGDDTRVAGHVLLLAGCLIGRGCIVYPRCSISGYIPPDTMVRPKSVPYEMLPIKRR